MGLNVVKERIGGLVLTFVESFVAFCTEKCEQNESNAHKVILIRLSNPVVCE